MDGATAGPGIELIAFDADDTLWHNETYFRMSERRFCELLKPWAPADHLSERLLETEKRNLALFGYGAKGFTLSLIETALDVTDGRVPGAVIAEILQLGKDILAQPVEVLDGAAAAITALAPDFRMIVVTKGDLLHQETKAARSGLADHFELVEIVSEKDCATYARVLRKVGVDPARTCMVGNSVRSDVLPMLELGGFAVHVPYHVTWAMEVADGPEPDHPRFAHIDTLHALPGVLARWSH
jgi:putative hydrolase of the HAD superfamily